MNSAIEETRKRGRPSTGAVSLHVRIEPRLLDQLERWIAARPEPQPSRPEALRDLAERALGQLDKTEMTVRYTDVQADRSAEAIFFDVMAYGERFPVRVSFEALEKLANDHGELLGDNPDDYEDYGRRWQPELKELALEKYRHANSVTITTKDLIGGALSCIRT
jgi:hypothetical protein